MGLFDNATTSVSNGGSTSASKTYGTEATAAAVNAANIAWQRNQEAVAQQQAYNAQQAQINREWQERMANTAYQRAVADMKAAKINPILAYAQGGAATPGGAAASSSALSASMANTFADSVSTGSSWNSAESSSNMMNQLGALFSGVADMIGAVKSTTIGGAIAGAAETVVKDAVTTAKTVFKGTKEDKKAMAAANPANPYNGNRTKKNKD